MKRFLVTAMLLFCALPVLAQQTAWTNHFSIEIYRRALPEIAANTVSITVVKGKTASKPLPLINKGNQPINFTTSTTMKNTSLDARWELAGPWVNFASDPDIDPPSINDADFFNIGFQFPYLNKQFSTIQIYANGSVILGFSLKLQPAEGIRISAEDVRYKLEEDVGRFTVSWEGARTAGGDEGLRFQLQLYKSGEIRYLYQNMGEATTNDFLIGYQTDNSKPETFINLVEEAEVADNTAILANDSMVILRPRRWLNASPQSGSLAPGTSPLTFIADATILDPITKQPTAISGTYNFSLTWEGGLTETIATTVAVESPAPILNVSRTTLPFTVPAGSLTKTNIVLSNTGNVNAHYRVQNGAAQNVANYTWTPNRPFNWSQNVEREFVPEDRDSGISELIPFGFPFPYFGTLYTNFSVGVDGFISLGAKGPLANQIIAPYMADLAYDNNSRILINGDSRQQVISWENLSSENGQDQSFQVILDRDGTIKFQYLRLDGTSWTSSDIANAIRYLTEANRPVAYGIGLKDATRIKPNNLIWSSGPDDESGTVTEEEIITDVSVTNVYTQAELDALDPQPSDRDTTTTVVNGQVLYIVIQEGSETNTVPVYADPLQNQAFSYIPADVFITASPLTGTLAPNESRQITVTGDARKLTTGSKTAALRFLSEDTSPPSLSVTFSVTAAPSPAELERDSDGDGQADFAEFMAGTDAQNADSTFRMNLDGSRTITWTAPTEYDGLNRTYTIYFTTNLLDGWQVLAQVENLTSYTDTEHNDVPAIYYKVEVK